jgi:hypothetical protein
MYAIEMASGGMIYIPKYREHWIRHSNVMAGTQTHRQQSDHTLFLQNKERRLKDLLSSGSKYGPVGASCQYRGELG